MISASRKKQFLFVASLATLVLRALTPDGYMIGSAKSGLLFELCPEGVPPGFLQALTGEHHHAHHGGEDDSSSVSSSQCPIGHLLFPAIAADVASLAMVVAAAPRPSDVPARPLLGSQVPGYRSRAPPA